MEGPYWYRARLPQAGLRGVAGQKSLDVACAAAGNRVLGPKLYLEEERMFRKIFHGCGESSRRPVFQTAKPAKLEAVAKPAKGPRPRYLTPSIPTSGPRPVPRQRIHCFTPDNAFKEEVAAATVLTVLLWQTGLRLPSR